jgi:hypothetical protein
MEIHFSEYDQSDFCETQAFLKLFQRRVQFLHQHPNILTAIAPFLFSIPDSFSTQTHCFISCVSTLL